MRIYAALDQIDDNPFQARQEYGDVAELAADIVRQSTNRPDTRGLQQVPTARLVADDGDLVPIAGLDEDELLENGRLRRGWRVQLEFGHRRKRAFDYLARQGLPEYHVMPLEIRDLDNEQMLDGVWQENRSRRDLSSVEEAELLARKLAQLGNQKAVADAWGIARATVTNKLALLNLPEEIQAANRDGRLSERAALSLTTVVKIQESANGVRWSSSNATYADPISPEAFISQVIEKPVSSEEIRKYTQRALKHAGEELPEPIASFRAEQGGDILRDSCAGCPKRINMTCLDAKCLAAKTKAFEADMVRQAGEVLGLPFSDQRIDFYHEREDGLKLAQLWQAGGAQPGTNFVYGLCIDSAIYAIRPLLDPPERKNIYSYNRWTGEGRGIIAIGHRGRVPVELLPGGEAEDIPDPQTIDDWKKTATTVHHRCRRTAKEAIKELLLEDVADFRVITALMSKLDAETTDDEEKTAAAVTKFLWDNGRWDAGYEPGNEIANEIERIGRLLDRMNVGRAVLGVTMEETAVIWLPYWYLVRKSKWQGDYHKLAQKEINAVRKRFEAAGLLSGEALTLSMELDRAAQDIERVLSKAD